MKNKNLILIFIIGLFAGQGFAQENQELKSMGGGMEYQSLPCLGPEDYVRIENLIKKIQPF